MNKTTTFDRITPGVSYVDQEVASCREQFAGRELLDQLVRRGAQQMLQQAVEAEVQEFLERHQDRRDENGNRLVVRNGHKPSRKITTGAGALEVQQPRVRDNAPTQRPRTVGFASPREDVCKRSFAGSRLIPIFSEHNN